MLGLVITSVVNMAMVLNYLMNFVNPFDYIFFSPPYQSIIQIIYFHFLTFILHCIKIGAYFMVRNFTDNEITVAKISQA